MSVSEIGRQRSVLPHASGGAIAELPCSGFVANEIDDGWLVFVDVFESHGEHEFDAVELVDLAGAWVVVDGCDVGVGVEFAEAFDHALACDVVGEARKWLNTEDIFDAVVDEFDHFGGEEPTFAGGVSELEDGFGEFHHGVDVEWSGESFALSEGVASGFLVVLDDFDGGFCDEHSFERSAESRVAEFGVGE